MIIGLLSQNLENNRSSILRTERESKFFPLPAASDDDNMGFLVQCRAMNCNLRIAIISFLCCEVSSCIVLLYIVCILLNLLYNNNLLLYSNYLVVLVIRYMNFRNLKGLPIFRFFWKMIHI